MSVRRLTILFALALACCPHWTRAYIDMPAEKLTLPRLLLEFRTSGVYRVQRFDPQGGAIRYELVEVIQGNPPASQKHILRMGGKIPEEIKGIEIGQQVLLMGADPYGRGLTFINGAWYVTNYERDNGWWRIAYTSAYFDFRCAFAGDLPLLLESCKALLDGEEAVVPCHPKAKSNDITPYRVTLRDPHKRREAAGSTTRQVASTRPSLAGKPIEGILAALAEPEAIVRIEAARVLGSTPEVADRSVPALCAAMHKDKDPFVRRQCAIALGRLGPAAESAIPLLFDHFSQGYEQARDLAGWEAAAAVGRIDPAGEKWLAEIRTRLGSKDSGVRRRAIEAIGILGPPARPAAMKILIDALSDKSPEIRYSAARSLDRIEAPAAVVAPVLAPLLADKDRDVPDAVRQTLAKLGGKAATEIGKMLAPAVEAKARRLAARLLHEMGPQCAGAKEALLLARTDSDEEVRSLVRKALGRLASGN